MGEDTSKQSMQAGIWTADSAYGPVTVLPGVDMAGLRPEVRRDFAALAREYHERTGGKRIQVNSAYRSSAKQAKLHAVSPDTTAAPGRSMHEYGYALDINSADAQLADNLGLLKKWGFVRPLVHATFPEPWHVERRGLNYAQVRAAGYAVAGGAGALLVIGGIVLLLSLSQRGGR